MMLDWQGSSHVLVTGPGAPLIAWPSGAYIGKFIQISTEALTAPDITGESLIVSG